MCVCAQIYIHMLKKRQKMQCIQQQIDVYLGLGLVTTLLPAKIVPLASYQQFIQQRSGNSQVHRLQRDGNKAVC